MNMHGFSRVPRAAWALLLAGTALTCGSGALGAAESAPKDKPAVPGAGKSLSVAPPAKPPVGATEWVQRARDAESRGLFPQAIENLTEAIALVPGDPRLLFHRAQLWTRLANLTKADADLTKAMTLDPAQPSLYLERGLVRLRMAEFAGSVADLEKYAQLRPARAAELWQLGIAQFYAGRYDDGRRLFELHRTVNLSDVENSAWHFACVAKVSGAKAAREAWLPVSGDARVPMAQIQDLMTGKGTAEAVITAAEGVLQASGREAALLYAHLYLSMYYGAEGRPELEARHAAEASKRAHEQGMMGEVARLHADWVTARMRAGITGRTP